MSERELDVYGIGNAIMDLQVNISEEDFSRLDLQKGTMNLVGVEQQTKLLESFRGLDVNKASGGSAANTMISLAQLGANTAYGSLVSDDQFGNSYAEEMSKLGVHLHNDAVPDATTGTSVILHCVV